MILEAKGIVKRFADQLQSERTVLDDISFSVNQGEFVSIIGRSGSGKSTLLYCLSGLMQPTTGNIIMCGTEITNLKYNKLTLFRREHTGFIFQNHYLIPSLNVYQNITIPAQIKGIKSSDEYLKKICSLLGICNLNLPINVLSGGEQQRVSIARALYSKPDILFADEPTSALDTVNTNIFLNLLKDINKRFGTTIVLVTHDLEVASSAPRTLVLQDGRLMADLMNATKNKLFEVMNDHV